jgi:hypothetical protein
VIVYLSSFRDAGIAAFAVTEFTLIGVEWIGFEYVDAVVYILGSTVVGDAFVSSRNLFDKLAAGAFLTNTSNTCIRAV